MHALLLFFALCVHAARFDSQPMPAVDVARYMGRWYEIARLPSWFERGCDGVTADLTARPDGSADAVNTCRRDGKLHRAKARLWSVDPSHSRLRVRFFWPFSGPYWVIAIDPDYQWVLIGHPKRAHAWIMARKPKIGPDVEARLVGKLRALGYDVSSLERPVQP